MFLATCPFPRHPIQSKSRPHCPALDVRPWVPNPEDPFASLTCSCGREESGPRPTLDWRGESVGEVTRRCTRRYLGRWYEGS